MFWHNVIGHNFKVYVTEINFLVNCLITNSRQTFNSGRFLSLRHLQRLFYSGAFAKVLT